MPLSPFDASSYAEKECLIVGGDEDALRIGLALNDVKAVLHIVAEEVDEELWWMAIDSGGSALLKDLDENDLPGRDLMVLVNVDDNTKQSAQNWASNNNIDTFLLGC